MEKCKVDKMNHRTTDGRSKKFSIIKPGPISERSKASLVMALDVMLKQEVPSLNFDGVELYKFLLSRWGCWTKHTTYCSWLKTMNICA